MKTITKKFFFFSLAFIFLSSLAWGAENLGQARLIVGITNVSPSTVNDSLSAQGLKKIEQVSNFGAEITFPVWNQLNLGMRYTKRIFGGDEDPANSATDYKTEGSQDAILLMARGSFFKTDSVMLDAFLGAGGTNTSLKITSASQQGELSKTASKDWLASPYGAAGVSASFGYKKIYFSLEFGYEFNKVDNFSQSGSLGSNYGALDLSGGYAVVGITFDGIPTFKK